MILRSPRDFALGAELDDIDVEPGRRNLGDWLGFGLPGLAVAAAVPALVIGLPVGFVGGAEAKAAARAAAQAAGLAVITNVGEKGGSAVAAAAFNAVWRLTQAVG